MGKITRKELNNYYLIDEKLEAAKNIFGNQKLTIYQTGYYSAPSWNWGYFIGLVVKDGKTYEVVTRFGEVVSAMQFYLPESSTRA